MLWGKYEYDRKLDVSNVTGSSNSASSHEYYTYKLYNILCRDYKEIIILWHILWFYIIINYFIIYAIYMAGKVKEQHRFLKLVDAGSYSALGSGTFISLLCRHWGSTHVILTVLPKTNCFEEMRRKN